LVFIRGIRISTVYWHLGILGESPEKLHANMIAAATLSLSQFHDRAGLGLDREMAEEEEFEMFIRNYQNMVFSVSARIVGNLTDAEDITQEVFIKAYDRFSELRNSGTVGGWLKTVATNLSINHLNRYRARWRFFSEQAEPVEIASEVEGESDRKEALELAIRKLPDAQRVPLVLFHFQEMSYEEIAAKLQVSLAKVKSDLHRGRETLKKLVTK
jgi:RNA polymerase sigma-70 factor (ECF subfamily)